MSFPTVEGWANGVIRGESTDAAQSDTLATKKKVYLRAIPTIR